ncbi:alpha/beta fold hydrolase [Kitasatospora sp. NPDC088346]|uniref:alpha/beta fold hydrolase n=1 Tax=Kitasatospora sp. NPDC088346 TaxID=3364073 RepID=UPI00381E1A41
MTTPRQPGHGTADRSPLRLHHEPRRPRAAVLLLHGGRADSLTAPPAVNLPLARMRPFAAALRDGPDGPGLLVASVRYRLRGWNGHRADALRDALRAVDELHRRAPGIPVVLVGHSMGGRAALGAAAHDAVRGVVALAPWCPPGEPVRPLAGRSAAFLHDEADRVTSARQTWDFARRAAAAGARVRTVAMPGGGHTMLRGARTWHRVTVSLTTAMLAGRPLTDLDDLPGPPGFPDPLDLAAPAGREG